MSKIQKFDAFLDSALKNKTTPEQVIAHQKEIFDKEILPSLQSQKANSQTIAQAQKEWNHFTTRSMAARGFIADRGENEGIRKDKLDTLQASKQGKGALAYSGLKAGTKDLKTAVARSSLNTVGSVARWANDIGENEKGSFLDNVANAMQEGGDAELNNATENYQRGMRGERVFKGPISNFGYRAGQMGGESLMQMAMPLGLAKGAGMALKAVAGAGKVAATGAMATGLGAGYTQNYGGVRDSATQNLKRDFSNPDSLADNPLFQQKVKNLYDAGMDLTKAQAQAYDETIDELSESKAEKWGKAITAIEFIAPGAATLGAKGAGRAVGQATVDRFTGLAATRAAVQQAASQAPRTGMSKLLPDTSFAANKASLGMVGRQGLEEGLQGGMENYAGQDASAEIGGKAVDWKAVGKQAAIEGAMGAVMGSGMQIASGHTPAKEAQQIADNIQQQQNAIATAYPQAKATLDVALQSGDQKAIEDAQLEFDALGNAAQNTTQQLNEYGISSSPEFKEILTELGLVNSADHLATDIGRKSDNQPFANKKAAQLFQKQNGLVDTHELVQLGRATQFVLRDKAAAKQPDLTSNIPDPQAQPPVVDQQQQPMPEDAIVSEPINSLIPNAEPVIDASVEPPKAGLAGIVDRVRTRQAGQINTLKSQFISAYQSGNELLANQLIDQAVSQHDLPQELVNQWLVEVGQVPAEQAQPEPDTTVSQTEINQNVTSPLNIFNQEYSTALQNNDAAAMHMATSKAFKSGLTGIEVQEAVQAARQTPPSSTDNNDSNSDTDQSNYSEIAQDPLPDLKDTQVTESQDGNLVVSPESAPTTTAGEFTQAFNTISKAASEGTRDQVAEYLREGKTERLTYSKPDAIEAALANENYNVQNNDNGSVTVIGVKDSQNNWVGLDPETPSIESEGAATLVENNPLAPLKLVRHSRAEFDWKRDKPQGTYASIVDDPTNFESPFEEEGQRHELQYTPKNPLTVDPIDVAHARFGGRKKGVASAGVAALSKLISKKDFNNALTLTKDQVVDGIKQKFPGVDTSRVHDAYEGLEVWGAQEAKKAGHDVIIARHKKLGLTPNEPDFSEAVLLNESIDKNSNTETAPDIAMTEQAIVDQNDMQSGDIGRTSDGKPFASKGAATHHLNKNNLKESHEIAQIGKAKQFVLRPKLVDQDKVTNDKNQISQENTENVQVTNTTNSAPQQATAKESKESQARQKNNPQKKPTRIRNYGWDRVEMARNLSLDELEQLTHQVEVEHANPRDEQGRYLENGQPVMRLYDQKGMKKLDSISWAIYHKTKKAEGKDNDARSNPPTNEKSEPIESKDHVSTHAYSKYDDVAKQYGRSVNANGVIVNSNGKESGARIVEKRGRVRIESHDGKLLFSGANPESLGNFIEEYWKGKKTEKAKSNERTEPQAIEKKINPDKPLASKNTKPAQGLTTKQARQALIDRFGHDTIIKLETMGKLEVINELGNIPNDALNSIMAFHGSPYKFDQFSVTHMGRGDGNQLYGFGLYFSDSKAVSEFYRKNLAKNDDGQLYQVDIDSDSKDILNWEDSLKDQEAILNRLKPLQDHLKKRGVLEQYEMMLAFPFDEWSGGELYTVLKHAAKNDVLPQPTIDLIEAVEMGRSDKAASLYLHHLGINGLKYAQSARDSVIPTGSSNYVIFDDSAIQITDTFFSQNPNGIEGYYHNGKVTLVASNLTPETVVPTFLHEMGGHAGMQGLMKPSTYDAIMQQFDQMVAAKNPLALEAKRRAEVETDPEVQRQEYLPYLITVATEAQQAGNGKGAAYQAVQRFIQRMVNAIKAWAVDKLGVNLKLNPDDVVALAERMVQRVAKAPATPSNVGANRSLNEASHSPFQKAIDDVVAGNTPRGYVRMGTTPNVLKMLGLPDVKVRIHGKTIEKVIAQHLGLPKGEHSNIHNLTPDDLRQLPQQLNDPIAVFKSGSGATNAGYVVLTELVEVDVKTGKSKPVVAALHIKQTKDGIDVIDIASTYGRSKNQLQNALNNDLLYWNKEKGRHFLTTERLQLPWDFTSDANPSKGSPSNVGSLQLQPETHSEVSLSTTNIKTNEDLVKYQSGKPLFSRRHTDFEGIPQSPTQAKEWAKQRLKEDFVQGYSLRKTGEWIRYHAATPLHIALTDKQFKPVFDLIQERMNHVAAESSHAMNKAPELLGRRENFADFRKETTNAISKVAAAIKVGGNKYQTDMDAAGKALFDGTRIDEKVYSNKELEQQGLTPDQIKRYREMRSAIDTSLEQAAKTHMSIVAKVEDIFLSSQIHRLHDLDLPLKKHREQLEATLKAVRDAMNPKDQLDARTIKRIDKALKQIDDIAKKTEHLQATGYAPMMRFGNYVLYVGDKTTGETKLYEMFETERERNRALESLQQTGVLTNNDEVSTSVKNPSEYKLFQEQGVNPETMALFAKEAGLDQDTMYQAYLKLAIAPQSSLKRMIHRKGVAGFSENAERVVSAFVISNARRSANLLYNQDIDTATMAIGDGKVQNYAQNLVDYTRNPMEEAASLRSFLFFMNMGFSFRYGLLNLTQPFIQTLPELSRYLNATQSSKLILSSNKLAWQSMRKDGEDALYGENSEFKADYEMLKRKGLLDPQNIWALQGRERGRSNAGSVWDVVQNASGTIAQLTETINRRTAMLTALRGAKSMGPQKLKQKGFDSPFEFAAHIIQSTQGVMNKGNRPPIARGIIGAPLMVFRTFSIQYVEQMIRLIKNPQYNGDRDKMRKALAFLMLILFGLAGAAGLPFVKDLIDVYETGRYYMGKPVNFERDVQELFGKEVAEHLLYGSINTFLFDMHGSTGAGDLLPGTRALHPDTGLAKGLLETGGATGGFVNKIMDGTEAAVQGKYKLAGQTLAPRAVGSLWQSADIATTGEYRTKYGNNLSEGTVLDSALKALDLNPTGFAQMGRTRMLEREDTAIRAAAQKRFREELIEAKREGDKERIGEIKADIKAWNKSNPKYPVDIADSSIARSVKRQDAGWEKRNKVPKGMEWVKELR